MIAMIDKAARARDPYNEWFQRNWQQLLAEYFMRRSRLGFDTFCEMQFRERRNEPPRTKDFGLLQIKDQP